MWKTRKKLEEERVKIKELYEKGFDILEIAEIIGVSKSTVHNALSIAGVLVKRVTGIDESNLIYADNTVKLEKVVINGKRYTDITPLFAPR